MLAASLLAADILFLLLWARVAAWTVLSCSWYALQRARSPRKAAAIDGNATVSILVPAYNEERNIAATLNSLISLQPPAHEIIVVDDGSSDGTALLAAEFLKLHPRGSMIRLPKNGGKAEALNRGLAAASGDLIATVDADTALDVDALGLAVSEMHERRADAVAFSLAVTEDRHLLSRLQEQEYALGFNFERAGQSLVGAIPVLPGAATLFRKNLLAETGFSSRTFTEDADVTLSLSRRCCRLILCGGAHARTRAPATLSGLLRQRIRWTAGHLHCCLLYLFPDARSPRFACLVFPNFLVSTLATPLLAILAVFVLCAGPTTWLCLSFVDVALISLIITYAQRLIASGAVGFAPAGFGRFILEPIVMGTVTSLSVILMPILLLKAAWSRRDIRR